MTPLWALHISDGVLTLPWLAGGFAVLAVLLVVGAAGIRDEEVPRVAVLTAAFFVASLIHVRLGPTSVHLLLNGLVGVVLGRRAALAVAVGLLLQALLLNHGGLTALGVNGVVLGVPALLAGAQFQALRRVPWLHRPWFRAGLVTLSVLLWTLSLVYSVTLLCTNRVTHLERLDVTAANALTFHPAVLAAAAVLAACVAWAERRLENAPEFALGLLVGEAAVLTTMALNCAALLWGGAEDWHTVALLVFVAHLPVAVLEGAVLGFTVGFLVRVKPEMVGWHPPARAEEGTACPADFGP